MYLEEIIGKQVFEDLTHEFKARLDRTDIVGWLKTIAGFANNIGGELFIGVEDKTSKLIGFDRKGADNERNFFNNMVNEHLYPRPGITVSFLHYQIREEERYLLVVRVSKESAKPVVLKYNGVPAIYIRREGFTNGASYEEILEMAKRNVSSYDTLSTNEKYNREDFSKLFEAYSYQNDGLELTDKKLISMGFMDKDGYLKNGSFLFSDKMKGKADIQCALYQGINRGDDRIISISKYNGNIIDGIKFAMDFVLSRENHTYIKTGTGRINIDSYLTRSVLEGVVNAFAHRDYSLEGTQIQIDMFSNRLEISSPGSFYLQDKIHLTYDLSSIISKRRNTLICDILVSLKLMEAAGTGFDKIMEDYKDKDDEWRPFVSSYTDHFTLTLPDLTSKGVMEEDDITYPYIEGLNEKNTKKILSFCMYEPLKYSEVASHLMLSDSTYFRKKIVLPLIVNGLLIEKKDKGITKLLSNREKVKKGRDVL